MIYSGKILATALKNKKISVTKLARLMSVSRGTVYYWFKQKQLSVETIHEIGYIIKYDFSVHQESVFLNHISQSSSTQFNNIAQLNSSSDSLYKEKYVSLLSNFKEVLKNEEGHVLNPFELNQLKMKVEHWLELETADELLQNCS